MNSAEKLHKRDARRSVFKPDPLKQMQLTTADVNKVFILSPDGTSGQILSQNDFLALDLDEIGEWYRIGELDVTLHSDRQKQPEMVKCPGCSVEFPKDDLRAQMDHMDRNHPEIIDQRRRAARI